MFRPRVGWLCLFADLLILLRALSRREDAGVDVSHAFRFREGRSSGDTGSHSLPIAFPPFSDQDPPLDTILAICTIWWIRDSYPSSIWAYADFLQTGLSAMHNDPQYRLEKPFGFSSFKEEISSTPEAWAGRNGNLQFYRYHDRGGHFPALEEPEAFARDMQDCFGKLWPMCQGSGQ